MGTLADVAVKVNADTSALNASLAQSEKSTSNFTAKLNAAKGPAIELTKTVVSMGLDVVESAVNLESSMNQVDAVFGSAADKIHGFSQTSVDSMAVSQAAFNEAVVPIGAMLTDAGLTVDETSNAVIGLSQSAADLAATFGGTTTDAIAVMTDAFNGDTEAARLMGLALGESDIAARAMMLGLAESTDTISEQAKAAAFLSLVETETADIQGAFAENSDSLAITMERVNASFENASALLGESLIPFLELALDVFNRLLGMFNNLPDPVKNAILILGGITFALAKVGILLPVIIGLVKVLGVVFGLALGPIGLITLAIAGIVTGIILLIKNWDSVKKATLETINFMAAKLQNFINFFLDEIINPVIRGVNKFAGLVGKKIPELEVNIPRFETAVDEAESAAEVFTADSIDTGIPEVSQGNSGPVTNINIEGNVLSDDLQQIIERAMQEGNNRGTGINP